MAMFLYAPQSPINEQYEAVLSTHSCSQLSRSQSFISFAIAHTSWPPRSQNLNPGGVRGMHFRVSYGREGSSPNNTLLSVSQQSPESAFAGGQFAVSFFGVSSVFAFKSQSDQ